MQGMSPRGNVFAEIVPAGTVMKQCIQKVVAESITDSKSGGNSQKVVVQPISNSQSGRKTRKVVAESIS